MTLRPVLTPPSLDEAMVQSLAGLASRLDGALAGLWDEDLGTFNRTAGTSLAIEDFQGIYKSEDHEDWVRRILIRRAVRAVADVTRSELVEIVRRCMSEEYPVAEAYMAIFDANVPLAAASNLLLYPLDYDPATNTWGGGRAMGEYDPKPEQVVEWALTASRGEDRA